MDLLIRSNNVGRHFSTGSMFFSLAALTKKAILNLCLDILPPSTCLPFSTNPFSDKALKKTRHAHIPKFIQRLHCD